MVLVPLYFCLSHATSCFVLIFIRISFLHFDSMFGTWSVSPYKKIWNCWKRKKTAHAALKHRIIVFQCFFFAFVCVWAYVCECVLCICIGCELNWLPISQPPHVNSIFLYMFLLIGSFVNWMNRDMVQRECEKERTE